MKAIVDAFPTLEEFARLYGLAVDDPEVATAYKLYDESVREEAGRQEFLADLKREAERRGAEKVVAKLIAAGFDPASIDQALKAADGGTPE